MAECRERIRGPSRDRREFYTSSRQVLRRLMILSEGRQFREAATIIGHLGPSILRSVVTELPIDILVESLPHSAHLIESVFNRLNKVAPDPRPDVDAETIIWHIVKLFGNYYEPGLRQKCAKLIQSIALWQPSVKNSLESRRRSLDRVVQGLGMHGLEADQNGSLLSLHSAIKNELVYHIEVYRQALNKIDELSALTVNQDPALSSHQRLLAISYNDMQQRLIDNKSLLTILDKPSLKQLTILLDKLTLRVQNDKDVLFSVGQIKRIDSKAKIDGSRPAAGMLMNFSRGCGSVLHTIGHIPVSPDTNSTNSSSDGYHSDSADSSIGDCTAEMVQLYRKIYLTNRSNVLCTLNSMPQLSRNSKLKEKILFSIIVLAFRACHIRREQKISDVQCVLEVKDCGIESVASLEKAVKNYLKSTAETFPLEDVRIHVSNQVFNTLYEYSFLKSCQPLMDYIGVCVRSAWKLCNCLEPYYLDQDFALGFLDPKKHERHPTSDKNSTKIREFIWPALIQHNHCVLKAVVVT